MEIASQSTSTNPGWREWGALRLQSIPGAHRLIKRWVHDHDRFIFSGLGAGMRFNAGQSNPAYVLGTNELPVQRALAAKLSQGNSFCDIGANVGFFTIIAARLVGSSGRVYAFEPVPENIEILKKNIFLNSFSNVHVIEAAASDHSGTGELLLSHYSGGSALATGDSPPDLAGSQTVDLVSLDELVRNGTLAIPDVVKIDVEGAELEVLRGMKNTLVKHKPVLIYEIDDQAMSRLEQKQTACQEFLHSCGYSTSLLEDSYPDTNWFVRNYLAAPTHP
jgi:FkbM family methyltransferase